MHQAVTAKVHQRHGAGDSPEVVRRGRGGVGLVTAVRSHGRVMPVGGHLLSLGTGAGRRAPPARRSGGSGRLARCGGRRCHSPHSAARPGSACHTRSTRTRWWGAVHGPEAAAVAEDAAVATPPGGRRLSTGAGGPAARRAGGTRGTLSLRHRYATGLVSPVGLVGQAGPPAALLSSVGLADAAGDGGSKRATAFPSARCARR